MYRLVTHIEDVAGPRGGERWRLTLSCGHVVERAKPKFSALKWWLAAIQGEPAPVATAPYTCKCICCAALKSSRETDHED